jgi:PBP1b-binding outer membrane lipoprotein LpoB
MRITIFAAAAFLALVLSGCAGTDFSYDEARKVKVGMTEDQVTQIMGPPYSVVSRSDGQMWVWSHANGMTGASRVISFRMVDGKVVEVPTIPASFK